MENTSVIHHIGNRSRWRTAAKKLRRGAAQSPAAAKKELEEFKKSYTDLDGWKKRKERIKRGMLEGARLVAERGNLEWPWRIRQSLQAEEKRRIGKAVARLIQDDDVIVIDEIKYNKKLSASLPEPALLDNR